MKLSLKRFATTAMLAPAIGVCLPAQAAPPDAGQASRELQPKAELAAPSDTPTLLITDEGRSRSNIQSQQRVTVKRLRFSGNQTIASSELEALLADLTHGDCSFEDIQKGVARVSALYRERGFTVARAFVAPQDVLNGEIEIQVLEGVLGQMALSNHSRLANAAAQTYLSDLQGGDVIRNANVERAIHLLGDTPGVGAAHATLQPGASVGHADLLVELDPTEAYAIHLEADNYGNRYVGEYRAGAALALNSPLERGDLLSLRGLTSGENLNYVRAAYQIPLGGDGFKLGAAYAETHYKLGDEFASLQQRGTATNSSVFFSYPFIRSRMGNLFATLTWEGKRLVDETAIPGSGVEKKLELLTLEWSGNHADEGGGVLMAFNVALTGGTLGLDSASTAQDGAPGSASAEGIFSKITYTLQRAQRFNADYNLLATLSGQQADKNLNSSEKFSLGGANGVRAYPQGEGNGDQGVLLNLELRRALTSNLQASFFYDTGSVDINRNPYATGAKARSIAGAGLGLLGQFGRMQIKCALAWPTGGGEPDSDTSRRTPRFWFQLSAPI